MQEILSFAKENKLIKLQLTSNHGREVARNLYKKIGFKKIQTDTFVLNI